MKFSLEELASMVEGTVHGDSSVCIEETRSLEQGASHAISFAIGDFREFAKLSKAGAILVDAVIEDCHTPQIVVPNAKAAFAKLLEVFHPPVVFPDGIHETAIIGKNVSIGNNVKIGPYCVVYDNAVIGDNVTLHAYVYIGHNTRIGEDSTIYANAIVHEN